MLNAADHFVWPVHKALCIAGQRINRHQILSKSERYEAVSKIVVAPAFEELNVQPRPVVKEATQHSPYFRPWHRAIPNEKEALIFQKNGALQPVPEKGVLLNNPAHPSFILLLHLTEQTGSS
ncbi:hypothetical protein [uncultured Pantoea sp.]|uniref:hypothetical protein n=1 Tax=uncultured Pantoea sp. TaxID=218084 RepID=UPI0025852248|nr:hypothetical protein [uncultured Pantoea sp.]